MFTSLKGKRFSDGIAEQIIGLIKAGHLRPGDALPSERDLARSLSVSRPPLREALKTLETMGFVERRSRRKAVVRSIAETVFPGGLAQVLERDREMVLQLLEVRKIIESWAAAQASRSATAEDIALLEAVYRDLEKDVGKEAHPDDPGVDADVKFHLTIYEAAHNVVLAHIASTLLSLLHQTQRVTRRVLFTEGLNRHRLLEQHKTILDAIRDGNPEAAQAAIVSHLGYAERYFVQLTMSR